MPGKCFPLGFSQQIFALKGNVCSASGCGTAAASTGWGPRDPALGPGVDTAHIHTSTRRGHLRSPGEGAGHGDRHGHGPLGALQLPQWAQEGPRDRWVERLPEPGSAPRSRYHPAGSLHLPGRCLRPQPGHQGPARRVRLQPWVALCSAHSRVPAHGRTVHCAPGRAEPIPCLCSGWHIWLRPASPRQWWGCRAGARGAWARKPPTAPPLHPAPGPAQQPPLEAFPWAVRQRGRGSGCHAGVMQGLAQACPGRPPAQGMVSPRPHVPSRGMVSPSGEGCLLSLVLGGHTPRRTWASAP